MSNLHFLGLPDYSPPWYVPASYSYNGIGKHYAMYHPTHKQCQLTFTFIDKQSNSVRRKISEAIKIHKDKPNFNNKEELVDTMKFIVR